MLLSISFIILDIFSTYSKFHIYVEKPTILGFFSIIALTIFSMESFIVTSKISDS